MPEPFAEVDLGSDTTLFYRPAEGGVEGFVVDNAELVRTLKQRVLDERGLSEVVEVAQVGSRGSSLADAVTETHLFEHQFAEPFSAVTAQLNLAPLDPPATETILLPLTLALGILIVIGLWALYRIVAVQIEFAERQNNFVSAVTHELKTPLTAIRMHGEMLSEGLVESEAKAHEYYRTITAQAERLSRLIGNVLWLSNIERNPKDQIDSGPLKPLIEQAARTLEPHVEKSGFVLHVEMPEDIPAVIREPDAVEQVLFNLVDNALKYAKEATDRRVTIACEVATESVKMVIRDRGPGVSSDRLPLIFEPFYRGENELTRKNTGTGLGLALVRDLADRMQATVQAENQDPGLAVVVEFRRTDAGSGEG